MTVVTGVVLGLSACVVHSIATWPLAPRRYFAANGAVIVILLTFGWMAWR